MTPSRIRRSESPASNSANLMLDEPPLMVRMRGLVRTVAMHVQHQALLYEEIRDHPRETSPLRGRLVRLVHMKRES